MKATIDIIKFRGLFFTTWTVEFWIQFTAAERAAIRHGKLSEKIFHDVGGKNQGAVTFGQISGGMRHIFMRHIFPTLLQARKDALFIEEAILPKIKSWLVRVES